MIYFIRILFHSHIIKGFILLYALGGLISQKEAKQDCCMSSESLPLYEGYRDAVPWRGMFLAVGTGGRIDLFDASATRIRTICTHGGNLNCATVWDELAVVAGDGGAVLWSADGEVFELAGTGTEKDINGMAARQDMIVAGADAGTIFVSVDGRSWNMIETGAKGDIVSVTAGESFFMAVTRQGEILRSPDGMNWQVTDYNEKYSGYNKPCVFNEVLAAGSTIVICGMHHDGTPAVITSTLGNVWAERILNYRDDRGVIRFLSNCPNSVAWDKPRDQHILACNNGEIFSLPSCTKCNESAIIAGYDIHAIACLDDMLFCGGKGFSARVIRF